MEGVADNSVDLDEAQGDEDLLNNANPAAGEILRGFGAASLLECLGRMGARPNTTASATCHSGEGQRDISPPQTNPPHWPCLELIVVSGFLQVLLFLQDK